MSTVIVVAAPLVVASWPLLSAAITAAIGTMGFAAANQGPRVRQMIDPKTRARDRNRGQRDSGRAAPRRPRVSNWSSNATASARSSAATRGAD